MFQKSLWILLSFVAIGHVRAKIKVYPFSEKRNKFLSQSNDFQLFAAYIYSLIESYYLFIYGKLKKEAVNLQNSPVKLINN